jgi:hypothetical protein
MPAVVSYCRRVARKPRQDTYLRNLERRFDPTGSIRGWPRRQLRRVNASATTNIRATAGRVNEQLLRQPPLNMKDSDGDGLGDRAPYWSLSHPGSAYNVTARL